MDSRGKKIKKSKKKKHTLPRSSQLPPPTPNMSPLPIIPRPPKPASQSSDFFKVPPPSSSLQYYFIPSHGGSASTTINFIPTPHFPASSPRGPASQIGGSPPIASPSHHSSQHGGSSFVPHTSPTQLSSPASSTPSISNLDIGGSHAAASPSTSTSTVAGTVRNCTGGTVQYDYLHRLIIVPRDDGFLPSFQTAHMVMESMKPFFNEPWNFWRQIPYQIRMNMWQQFKV
ncbi:PREDICTED: proline-rich receptor-like protein kinase PERK2 isoform X2 [Nicotiana attenuata]|nr:PREDICTED: proline-rich receptor-like protein kinase PERK2 isoform X2 [Nicotiana attenuata]